MDTRSRWFFLCAADRLWHKLAFVSQPIGNFTILHKVKLGKTTKTAGKGKNGQNHIDTSPGEGYNKDKL